MYCCQSKQERKYILIGFSMENLLLNISKINSERKENEMGLDLSLYDEKEQEICSLNWLRNPFGLCECVEQNVEHEMRMQIARETSLYYVCNHWNYNKSKHIDRNLFLTVVKNYDKIFQNIETLYFFFNFKDFLSFCSKHSQHFPRDQFDHIKGIIYHNNNNQVVGIPINHFRHPCWHLGSVDQCYYYQWMKRLVEFAEALQNQKYKFYCSN
jgi:hypothetical protein